MRKTAWLIPVLAVALAYAADVGKGKAVYDAKCASCHGKDGKGNPAMAKIFKVDVAALDLTDAATSAKPDADIANTLSKGMNKMPSFAGKLAGGEIADVTAYIRSLGGGVVAAAPAAAPEAAAKAPASAVDLGTASALYAGKCASCHGKDGKGNPAMAKVFKVDESALNLTDAATLGKSDTDLVGITLAGVNKMPAFKDKMTSAEAGQVVAYMRSLGGGQ